VKLIPPAAPHERLNISEFVVPRLFNDVVNMSRLMEVRMSALVVADDGDLEVRKL